MQNEASQTEVKEILNVIYKTIYQFFDVCGDDEEVPMSDKDKLLLEVNKAICNNLKVLEQKPCEDVSDINDENMYECSCGYGWDKSKVVRHHFCPNCGRKALKAESEVD